jgi:methylated-DNA-[protein]-cysteine S-methyltransferase
MPDQVTARFFAYHISPIGWIEIGSTDEAVVSLYFVERRPEQVAANEIAQEALRQVVAYLGGARAFDLALHLEGTEFQRAVWQQLLEIPYGHTLSYQEVAAAIGRPRAVRAVGAAVGRNPISIIVPCHRVVGSDGSLTGYGGGLWRKEWLLRHEGSLLI